MGDSSELIDAAIAQLQAQVRALPEDAALKLLNRIRLALHEVSPLREEPIDCVLWFKAADLEANDYNPNSVAAPELLLLEHSIVSDGYTQPVVTWVTEAGVREVVDGFHRTRVGKESPQVMARTHGHLPVTTVNTDRTGRGDRMASTIRHNRARGRHQVQAMSEIVVDLARRNWSDARIAKELGMDADEVLRLKQISGLAEMFADREFSEAWEIRDVP